MEPVPVVAPPALKNNSNFFYLALVVVVVVVIGLIGLVLSQRLLHPTKPPGVTTPTNQVADYIKNLKTTNLNSAAWGLSYQGTIDRLSRSGVDAAGHPYELLIGLSGKEGSTSFNYSKDDLARIKVYLPAANDSVKEGKIEDLKVGDKVTLFEARVISANEQPSLTQVTISK